MMNKKILTKRIVSADGRVIAEAQSIVVTSSDAAHPTPEDAASGACQTVMIESSSQGTCSSSSSSSSTSRSL